MSAALFYLPFPVAVTSRGVGAPAAKAYFYLTGTLTKLAIYTTSALTTQASNPTTADGAGRFNEIYLDNTKTYRLVIKDQRGTTLCDVDPYIPGTAPDASALSPYSDAAAASAVAASSSASGAAGSAATAVSSASAAAAYLASLTTLPTSGMSVTAASRTALALLSTSAPAILTEEGRTGTFKHYTSAQYLTAFGLTLSTLITADTAQGIFVSTATGAWVRQINGSISPMWFGMVEGYTGSAGANSTANNAAWTAMMSAIGALGKNASSNFKGVPDVLFPSGCFEFSTTPDITIGSLRIRGTGMGHVGSTVVTGSTRIKCYDCGGFRFQSTNTSGVSTGDAVSHQGSDQSSLEDIGFEGNFVATEAEYHGVHIRAQTHLRNVVVSNFAGDGFRLEGNTAGVKGNTNSSTLINCHGWGNRQGMYFTGNNTGSSVVFGGSFNNNRRWGIKNSSSIGSMFYGCETSNNGTVTWNDGSTGKPATVVSDGTYRYFCLVGQESLAGGTNASINAPSGTATDNAYWGYLMTAGSAAGIPLWSSGMVVDTGGNFMGSGANLFSGCYGEANNQGLAQGQQADIILGGKLAVNAWLGGTGTNGLCVIRSQTGGQMFVSPSFITPGSVTSTGDKIGYSSGAGGVVTQATSKSTPVTLDKLCGQVTMNNAALAAGAKVSFAVSNSKVITSDIIVVNVDGGGTANAYRAAITAVGSNTFTVTVENITAGSLSEAPVISFAIIKGVTA